MALRQSAFYPEKRERSPESSLLRSWPMFTVLHPVCCTFVELATDTVRSPFLRWLLFQFFFLGERFLDLLIVLAKKYPMVFRPRLGHFLANQGTNRVEGGRMDGRGDTQDPGRAAIAGNEGERTSVVEMRAVPAPAAPPPPPPLPPAPVATSLTRTAHNVDQPTTPYKYPPSQLANAPAPRYAPTTVIKAWDDGGDDERQARYACSDDDDGELLDGSPRVPQSLPAQQHQYIALATQDANSVYYHHPPQHGSTYKTTPAPTPYTTTTTTPHHRTQQHHYAAAGGLARSSPQTQYYIRTTAPAPVPRPPHHHQEYAQMVEIDVEDGEVPVERVSAGRKAYRSGMSSGGYDGKVVRYLQRRIGSRTEG
ncbi:uncharacterized protein EV422DRAFT_217899 [Fimicolochytrium jonesii]|uniref:uncharacterized protein n=1 Tax=Fimicolochytrium jonesii TaxID=1396493 RepID=UPI0022FE2839|nr:uncharacterized protein EV422DRAFT_217899 [Fimicolochytrium jonesii]KAI8817555.1 hypothetical protein EV422DRAFT_217899 [Fimicolochytrium jonesii]